MSSTSSASAPALSFDQNTPQDEATSLARLLETSAAILRQAVDLVEDGLTSDDQLSIQSNYIPGSTIGKHLRHARDHFALLLDTVSQPPPHVLNYDKRARNTPMETSRAAARVALNECIAHLHQVVPQAKWSGPITLHAITPFPQVMETTFGRELWFAGLHAIHHWSMVRVIAGELGIKMEDSFGFAPSTLVYKASKPKM